MLRNRSRAVTSKQALMSENTSQFSQIQVYTRPIASIFNFSRFRAFTKAISPFETESALLSPTSILDANPSIFPFTITIKKNTKPICFFQDSKGSKSPKFHKPERPLGLADLVNTKVTDENKTRDTSTDPINKTVVFGSNLRVQIPNHEMCSPYPFESPRSPADYGTRTRQPRQLGGDGPGDSCVQTKLHTGCLSVSEMELSEDYTCVTCHGPNPKTTHIFDNHIVVESYCALLADEADRNRSTSRIDNFLNFCYTCKKNLDQNDDIFIYRGEKAFCSGECRYQEMLIDEMEN